jgi:hypothetical protein
MIVGKRIVAQVRGSVNLEAAKRQKKEGKPFQVAFDASAKRKRLTTG